MTVFFQAHFQMTARNRAAGPEHVSSVQFGEDDISVRHIHRMTFDDDDVAVEDALIFEIGPADVHGKEIFRACGDPAEHFGIADHVPVRQARRAEDRDRLCSGRHAVFLSRLVQADASGLGTSREKSFFLKGPDVCEHRGCFDLEMFGDLIDRGRHSGCVHEILHELQHVFLFFRQTFHNIVPPWL